MSDSTVPEPDSPTAPVTQTSDENAARLDGASTARLLTVLIALIVFSEIVPLQYAMTGVLIPQIGASFPAAGVNTSWALTILGVVGAATMALSGKASDLWGKKRVLLILGVFFVIGTVICALTHNWAVFLVGRGFEAVCLGISAVGYGIVRDLMPRRWIPIAVGLVATGFGVSAVLAPVVGGLLTDHYSWRSVFWFLIIYGVVTSLGVIFLVPESPYRVRERMDWLGSLMLGAGLAGILIYVSEGTSWGWGSLGTLAYLIGGVLLLGLFVAWESRISFPMMELSLLRKPQVAIAMGISLFCTICLTITNYLIPYQMETPKPAALRAEILAGAAAKEHVPVALIKGFVKFQGDINYAGGLTVFQLAWHVTIVLSAAAMVFGPLGGFIARRYGARLTLIIGTVALVVAFELWSRFHGSWVDQASISVIAGAGVGFFYAGGPNLLIDAVPPERQGISSGMYAVFGAFGTALATACVTPILAAHPFELVATEGGKTIVQAIPQVYTNVGFAFSYLYVGVIPAALALILAFVLRAGRTGARGGATDEESLVPATVGETVPLL